MHSFITEVLGRFTRAGFVRTTVGHRFYTDFGFLPTGSIRQFHYYPFTNPNWPTWAAVKAWAAPGDANGLPPFSQTQAIVGEFGVRHGTEFGGPWPELGGRDVGTEPGRARIRTFERLKHLHSKGYQLAFLWPDMNWMEEPPPEYPGLKLTLEAQAGIQDYNAWTP